MNTPLKGLLILLFITTSFLGISQPSAPLSIEGTVVDAQAGDSIPYATILIKSKSTANILAGATTDTSGFFIINTDSTNIFLEVKFIGYTPRIIDNLALNSSRVQLDTVQLSPDDATLDAVEVRSERSTMEFKLDKRVFNVGSDISSTGMGALEVLNNVPSVNVDIEGQISLRGNSGVQILINGKPSVLADEQSNALGTITADMIERIEVITNPSAKYNAEGTSGIINIVLKKEDKKGINGSVSVNTGYPNNHSLGASLNLRKEKFNFFTQFGAGYRTLPRYSESSNQDLNTGTIIESVGEGNKNEIFYNLTLGTDYYINDYNVITLSGRYAYEFENQPSVIETSILNEGSIYATHFFRNENTTAQNPKWQYDLQYKKEFKNNKDHSLQFSTLGSFFGKDQASEFTNEYTLGTSKSQNQRTETDFYQADYTFKLDYINPITKKITLETGALYELNDVGNDYAVYSETDGVYVIDSSLTNNFEFDQKVLGVYATGSYEGKKWGVKLGLRAENTNLTTLLINTNEQNTQNYTNLFPSVHTSYKISKTFSLQAGYSKRIFRPRLWNLNPFFNVSNTYNIRTGNPNLQPEFADSYEVTSIFLFKKVSLNASIYHLYTTNVMEYVSYYSNNIQTSSPINVGTRQKTGLELNGKYSPKKWLSLNGEVNFGYFNREGVFNDQVFDFNGSQWSSKLTTKFKLPADIDIEITGNYQSRYQTVQGEVSGFLFADAGIRKKLWKGKAVVNVAVRDIFASRIRESYLRQPEFTAYNFSQRGRFVTLGFSYSFGKGEAMTYSGGRRH